MAVKVHDALEPAVRGIIIGQIPLIHLDGIRAVGVAHELVVYPEGIRVVPAPEIGVAVYPPRAGDDLNPTRIFRDPPAIAVRPACGSWCWPLPSCAGNRSDREMALERQDPP